MDYLTPDKGRLLISEPSIIGDESFSRSVVLITEFNDEGVVGFILNKKINYTLDQLVPEVSYEIDVFHGGPVDTDNLYFIHRVPHLIPNSHQIEDGIYWGGDFSTVADLLNEGKIRDDQIRFFLGYSGWTLGQLENEMEQKSWVIKENDSDQFLLSQDSDGIWRDSMRDLGGSYQLWSNAPENPQYN
jgi:putative transcriptional regulator